MRGIIRDIVIKGAASGLSKVLLKADLTRLLINAQRLGGLDEDQVESLRVEIVERLERAEAEGREQRDLLGQVTSELLASWLPIGRQPPEKK
jgi:hypothetical protein